MLNKCLQILRKAYSGFSLSHMTIIHHPRPHSPIRSFGSPVRPSLVRAASSIGRSSVHSRQNVDWPLSSESLDSNVTLNFQDPLLPLIMSTSSIHGSTALNLTSDVSLSDGTPRSTGSLYGPPPSPETYSRSRLMFVWCLTGRFELLHPIMMSLNQSFEHVLSSGVQLELESPEELGRNLDWQLIVRTRGASSGVDMEIRSTLFWTSFEVTRNTNIRRY